MSSILPHSARGPEGRTPIVFLHGFAGSRETWLGQQIALETRRRTIAFDLPGHGAALDWPEIGHAGISAKAVIASLSAMGIERFHLVGHSMGGATAVLVAMKLAEAERVASLTLLAPGGFGDEINQRLLRRFAVAVAEHEIHALLEQFFGYERPVPLEIARHMAGERRDPRVTAALARIVEAILDGERQKSFDLSLLGGLPHPVRLIWGNQDRVLPTRQSRRAPGTVGVHVFAGVGHMPHLEVPREVTRILVETCAAE
ncbi:alpha/beta fold hydrolase [Prosthecomicrobium hirschii]|uniref:alpha/beta fold hydrolase n=1 Tax=Prosthecodimorpha hirschii TaxID=665126 RepID=UPI002220220A|nr:alpha/beta fold hydrolase [Prosthecomicrobium hirschii]MCW1842977.1 alpha/beta fold hydrolase [Prosthecomicrobium hirschii]